MTTTIAHNGKTGSSVPAAGLGTTTIDDNVVAEVAGIASQDVKGVHALGGGVTRAIGAIRDALKTTDRSQGINVTVTDEKVSVDVTFSADYPVALQQVASDVRSAVILAIETIVGLEVTAVNVTVNAIFTPDEESAAKDAEPAIK